MAKSRNELYCDETGIHKGAIFHFGGLHCSSARAKILDKQIKDFRSESGCIREMHWTKVSKKMLPKYIDFVNIFLQCPYSTFNFMAVKKDKLWYKWKKNEEERFFGAYYQFISHCMFPNSRYGLYLDYKESKPYRWNSLEFVLKRATRRNVHTLLPCDSHDYNLIQLTDVLLGSLTSQATGEAKVALASYVQSHLDKQKKWGTAKKITYVEWNLEKDAPFLVNYRSAYSSGYRY